MIKKMFRSLMLFSILFLCLSSSAFASDEAAKLEKSSRAALQDLYKQVPGASKLAESAKAILVFPTITKGGFVIGAQYGRGTLFEEGKASSYYSTAAASYGLQAGLQKFGYALFFMGQEDLDYLKKSEGWELGVGPSLTVVDEGVANSMSTTTARKGVYVFFFSQKGLMAGLGIQGSKITKIEP